MSTPKTYKSMNQRFPRRGIKKQAKDKGYLLVVDNGETEERYEYDTLILAEKEYQKFAGKCFSASVYEIDLETGEEKRIRYYSQEENDARKKAWGL